ncbi:MAG: hypothetical protein II744_00580 [Eubacterium sp.]|nr:hypothetical protein [Eubacterium sp.]
MRDIESLCANCFEELSEGAVCANCGYDNDTAVDFTLLQPKSELLERYVVGAVASTESDSVTY